MLPTMHRVINSEGKIIIYNKAATIKLKLNPDQVIGHFIEEAISKKFGQICKESCKQGYLRSAKRSP